MPPRSCATTSNRRLVRDGDLLALSGARRCSTGFLASGASQILTLAQGEEAVPTACLPFLARLASAEPMSLAWNDLSWPTWSRVLALFPPGYHGRLGFLATDLVSGQEVCPILFDLED